MPGYTTRNMGSGLRIPTDAGFDVHIPMPRNNVNIGKL